METVESSQTTTQETAQAPGTETIAAPSTETTQAAQTTSDATQTTEQAPAWKPDFKFKVMDKEHEIEEWARSAIKDEETLKKARELYEKAYGLEPLKQSRDEFKTKYQSLMPQVEEYKQVTSSLNRLSHFVQQKDFGSFFDNLKIPRADIFRWVKQELELSEQPPELQQQLRAAQEYQAKLYDIQQQMQSYQSQLEQQNQAHAQMTIGSSIAAHAKEIAEVFNERAGDPQAFYNAVMQQGALHQQQTGEKLPVDEVVKMVAEKAAKFIGYTPQASKQQDAVLPTASPQTNVIVKGDKPVLPNAKAGGASPVKKNFKSLDDLKKHAASMQS